MAINRNSNTNATKGVSMSEKTFIQELETIKKSILSIMDEYNSTDEEICIALKEGPIKAIQGMINKCIEIQNIIMSQTKG